MRKTILQNKWGKVIILSMLVNVSAGITHAAIVELEPFHTGSLRNDSGTVVEQIGMLSGWEGPSSTPAQRSFYYFQVPTSTETIISAEWQFIDAQATVGFFGYSFYDLFDATTEYLPRETEASFNDLGSGKEYGRQTITDADQGETVRMSLSVDAVADLNVARTSGGLFGMGSTFGVGDAVMWIISTSELPPESDHNMLILVTETTTTPGDFDTNGIVDGADFLKWQRGESPNPLSRSDLAVWEANYGTVAPLAAASAVPEPSSLVLIAVGLLVVGYRRRNRA